MLRFPQISRVFAEPLARELIVQSSDDAPYPIALCFEVCIGRHVRLRYIAGKRRSRQTLENGLRKVKPLSALRQAESQTRRTDLSSAIPRRKVVTGFALRSNGTAPAVRLQRPCTYGWVVSSGDGLSRLDTSLRDPINDVFVRQCHDCQMSNDDHVVDKPPPYAGGLRTRTFDPSPRRHRFKHFHLAATVREERHNICIAGLPLSHAWIRTLPT